MVDRVEVLDLGEDEDEEEEDEEGEEEEEVEEEGSVMVPPFSVSTAELSSWERMFSGSGSELLVGRPSYFSGQGCQREG